MHRIIFATRSSDLCLALFTFRDVRKWLTAMRNGIFLKNVWKIHRQGNAESKTTRNYLTGSRPQILSKIWAGNLKCILGPCHWLKPLYVWGMLFNRIKQKGGPQYAFFDMHIESLRTIYSRPTPDALFF